MIRCAIAGGQAGGVPCATAGALMVMSVATSSAIASPICRAIFMSSLLCVKA